MVRLTDQEIGNLTKSIERGILNAYYNPINYYGKLPSAEVVEEIKADIKEALTGFEESDDSAPVLRMKKLGEIADLLLEIQPQDFLRNEHTREYLAKLGQFSLCHAVHFNSVSEGNRNLMLSPKYDLVAAKSRLGQALSGPEPTNGSVARLVELGDKYLELLKI
ncbi:MAG: hypothetical protein KKH88_02945 [Nanoarchaeota archaeon]|nr:hypothetical protein [Nanoarchaeota archaeon]